METWLEKNNRELVEGGKIGGLWKFSRVLVLFNETHRFVKLKKLTGKGHNNLGLTMRRV